MMPRIPYGRQSVDEGDIQAVADAIRQGIITGGPVIDAFTEAIANYVGARYAVAVSTPRTMVCV